jgi:hypothetical protein
MSAVASLALAPWRFSQQWFSWWLGLLFTGLARAGVAPAGFVEQAKVGDAANLWTVPMDGHNRLCTGAVQVREIQGVLAHMHIREDSYRKVRAGWMPCEK